MEILLFVIRTKIPPHWFDFHTYKHGGERGECGAVLSSSRVLLANLVCTWQTWHCVGDYLYDNAFHHQINYRHHHRHHLHHHRHSIHQCEGYGTRCRQQQNAVLLGYTRMPHCDIYSVRVQQARRARLPALAGIILL